jgi:hypothetical protein
MRKLIIIGLLLLTVSCERKTDWNIQPSAGSIIAVDGRITDERKSHIIKIMVPATELNGATTPMTGANVTITDGTTTWALEEIDSIKGTYCTDSNINGISGKNYTLKIVTKDKEYTATDQMYPAAWFSPLQYEQNSNDSLYHITWVASVYNSQYPALYEIFLDWSSVPGYESSNPLDCQAKLYYFTLNTLDISEVFAPEIEKISFPAGTQIIEKKYSVSPAFESFIRCLLLETNWRGGMFDVSSANLPTNLSEGGTGFFSASMTHTLSITVTP